MNNVLLFFVLIFNVLDARVIKHKMNKVKNTKKIDTKDIKQAEDKCIITHDKNVGNSEADDYKAKSFIKKLGTKAFYSDLWTNHKTAVIVTGICTAISVGGIIYSKLNKNSDVIVTTRQSDHPDNTSIGVSQQENGSTVWNSPRGGLGQTSVRIYNFADSPDDERKVTEHFTKLLDSHTEQARNT